MKKLNKIVLAAAFTACSGLSSTAQITHVSEHGGVSASLNGTLCVGGGFSNAAHIGDDSYGNFGSYSALVDLLACTATVRVPLVADVTTTTIATSPGAQRFAGFYIGNPDVLALLTNATINTYNNGSLVESFSGTGLLSALTVSDEFFIYAYATQPFNEVELAISNLAGALTSINYYYGFATADTFALLSPLSVSLESFEARVAGATALLNWQTDEKDIVSSFAVERSTDGRTFSSIAELKAGMGTTVYSYTDKMPADNTTNYYRIKTTEASGEVSYSRIEGLHFGSKTNEPLTIYPNPTRDQITIKSPFSGKQNIHIRELQGRIIYSTAYERTGNTIDLSGTIGNFAKGTYWIELIDSMGDKRAATLVLQ
jgi:hypothetical protein